MAKANKILDVENKRKNHYPLRVQRVDKIHHPKSGAKTHSSHFAAFGTALSATSVRATLTNQRNQFSFDGDTILQPSGESGFWIVLFLLNHVSKQDPYTLVVVDADNPTTQIDVAKDISIKQTVRGQITITYPQGDDKPPPEFAAYGTTDSLGNMQGTFSNVLSMVTQSQPPLDWVLHCVTNGQPGHSTTLTVSQPTGTPSVLAPANVTFTFAGT